MIIESIKMKLIELQDNHKNTMKFRSKELPEDYDNIEQVFYYQSLLYVSKVIFSKLISKYHNNLFVGYFGIQKVHKLITKKYY